MKLTKYLIVAIRDAKNHPIKSASPIRFVHSILSFTRSNETAKTFISIDVVFLKLIEKNKEM
jgi:hypothetical protein